MIADVEHVDRYCMKLTADRATRRVTGARACPDAAAAIQGRATVVGGPAHDRQARYDGWVEREQVVRFHSSSRDQNLINYGYSATAAWGENVYAGDGVGANGIDNASSLGTFTWWKSSPAHNANMLSATFKAIGTARVHNTNSTYHYDWTTDFGSSVGSTVTC